MTSILALSGSPTCTTELLAASGAGVAASSIVSQRVVADGGSPTGTQDVVVYSTPILQAGSQYGPVYGAGPDTNGALFAQFSNGVACLNGATLKREYRVSRTSSTGPSLNLTLTPSIPLDAWSPVSNGYLTITYASTGGSVIGGSLGLRLQHRITCCLPSGGISWRCFQADIIANFVASNTTTTSATTQTNSANCENPGPTCP